MSEEMQGTLFRSLVDPSSLRVVVQRQPRSDTDQEIIDVLSDRCQMWGDRNKHLRDELAALRKERDELRAAQTASSASLQAFVDTEPAVDPRDAALHRAIRTRRTQAIGLFVPSLSRD
jgi:predicted  nucleic acid-binding Zn-ribbon protein